jgi:hypothetical protein
MTNGLQRLAMAKGMLLKAAAVQIIDFNVRRL